ncbi:PKD repeat protein [Methanolinea mesophila]|uniref:beta strand repeat-containing protein n=1 Tax=Methanolinea mesophila TaxID=547055 RepID=UPI001AE4061D|nr:PKD domain-containing protein [Methanolinea mesophila]MBP1927943.1 PKD repeat protein [Methanolinea mesophila]
MNHSRVVKYAVPLLLLVLVGVPVSAALSLNGITPATGLNNGTVFITNLSGTDFPMDATVLLNRTGYPDIPGMYVTVADPTRITCVMDLTGKQYGPWNVVVNDPTNVTSAVLPNGFTIMNPPPYLYGIVPASGINTGSVGVSISGANFYSPSVNLTNVTYGTIVGTGVTGNASDIACTFDLNGRNEGLYDLVLTNGDGQSVTLPNAFRVTYPPPVITSITPSSGINNGVIGITDLAGANFMNGAIVTLVKTGETPIATINGPIVQPNKILCFFDLTGKPVGVWNVVVDNPDGQNGTLAGAFTIYYPQAPMVTGITPATGVNDGPIVIPDISGTGFENNLTVNLTMSGQPDIPGTNVIRVSGTQVNATFDLTGVATGAWDVVVTNNDGQSGTLPAAFTVTNPPPTLVSITPDTGVNTGPVAVTDLEGTGFVTGATVTLTRTGEPDIVATGVTVVNSTTITCTLDITNAAAGLWNVTVENTDAQSATLVDGFNITNPAPTVTMLTPSEGVNTAPAYISDLAGTGFLPGATAKLSMTGQPDIVATGLTVVNPTSITCTFDITGVATGSWDVTVENPDGLTGTLTNGFNVTNPAPTLTGIDPTYGTNNGLVPILNLSGTGFLPGITAKLTKTGESDIVGQGLVVTSTKIICFFDLTGAKVGPWDVVVENIDGKSATLPDGFIVYYPQAPSITSITPDQGITFQTVSITDLAGSGFEPGVTVNLTKAGEPTIVATNVTRVSGSQITCDFDLTGAVVGPWTVVVTNDDGQLGTLNNGFVVKYPAPTVTSITPATGINNGPVFITDLAGTAFRNGATVTLEKVNQSDITATNVTVVHRGKITCTFNLAGAVTGPWDVVVRNDDGQSGTLPAGFTVQNPAPTVTSISPNKGPNDRSLDIGSLQGTGFLSGATVKLTRTGQPDIVATHVTVQSPTLINCTVDLSGAMTGLWNVVVTNTDGKSGSLPNGFTITPPPPVAAFTGNPTLGTVPLTVQFTDDSLNGPTVWVWDFGDGTLAGIYEQNPVHTYNAPGVYNVTLTVFNAGGSDTVTKYDYITVVTRPIANFTAAPTDGTAPLLVHFTDTSDGNPTKWTWKFGDGSFSIQQNPYHLYTKAGVYNVSLTVLNPAGADTLTKYSLITVRSLPVAAFTANTTAGMSPLAVQFLDQSTGDPTNWTWSFGDGGMSTDQNPVHVYTQAGTYSVQLIASNPSGMSTETKNRYINVQEGLQAAFTYTTSNPDNTAPLSVAFTDTSTDRPLRWTWQFGDGYISTDRNPIHNYPVAGNYTITLTVTGLSGTSATSQTIVVTNPLEANFDATPTQGSVPLTVLFMDTSIGEPNRWFWTFGDGQFQEVTNPAEKNVVHTYNSPGNYTVALTVTDDFGSSMATKTNFIRVLSFP